ncbi:urea amidolyase associated protein UAAP1 [Krasilnikovia sp. M28-CT-15]|uniref:urea amidolyase associated protein UAAP1 n=1 Tax=Krasilnikovia sp. M28-CT-15 TaxID=3373540 RepID=UPI003876F6AA
MTQGYRHDVPGGAAWSLTLRCGSILRLEARGTDAVASVLLFAAADPMERLNVPDTLKAQMSARITPPMVLMSDLGRALASVTGSSLDWHDAITGHSIDADLDRFGTSDYGRDRNGWRRSARSLLLDELYVHGLGERDLHACVNFFAKAAPASDDRAALAYVPGHAGTGDWVRLRAEQDLLVVLATAPHPLDPAPRWDPAPVRADVAAGDPGPIGADDPSMTFRAESARALAAAERSLL